eukprot:6199207-Pleurochrysis_carterae.AAC.2
MAYLLSKRLRCSSEALYHVLHTVRPMSCVRQYHSSKSNSDKIVQATMKLLLCDDLRLAQAAGPETV